MGITNAKLVAENIVKLLECLLCRHETMGSIISTHTHRKLKNKLKLKTANGTLLGHNVKPRAGGLSYLNAHPFNIHALRRYFEIGGSHLGDQLGS